MKRNGICFASVSHVSAKISHELFRFFSLNSLSIFRFASKQKNRINVLSSFHFANFTFLFVTLPYFSFRFGSLPYFSFRFRAKIEAVFSSFRFKIFCSLMLAFFCFFPFVSLLFFRFVSFSFRL
jgi:hypothetical protein